MTRNYEIGRGERLKRDETHPNGQRESPRGLDGEASLADTSGANECKQAATGVSKALFNRR